MQQTKKTEEQVKHVEGALVLAQLFRVDVTKPALVSSQYQPVVASVDPEQGRRDETNDSRLLEHCIRENPREGRQNI